MAWQVRVNALICLGELVHWLDKRAVLEILQTLQRCTAVDHSAPTLMCSLGVANAIYKQHGIEFAAEHLLPLLAPLLVAQQLNLQQFAKYMLFVKEILRKIEEKRGVTLNESGPSPMYMSSESLAGMNGFNVDPLKQTGVIPASGAKTGSSWDAEDWGSIAKASKSFSTPNIPTFGGNSSYNSSMEASAQSSFAMSEIQPALSVPSTSGSSVSSCPPVDIEWPSQVLSSTAATTPSNPEIGSLPAFTEFGSWTSGSGRVLQDGASKQSMLNGNTNILAGSAIGIDDIDPFADWPPCANTNNDNSREPIAGLGAASSLGNTSMQNQPAFSAIMANSSLAVNTNQWQTDIGSIFAPSKTESIALKIAPPPPSGVGRGRGRGKGRSQMRSVSQGINAKPPVDQPPLLDLL